MRKVKIVNKTKPRLGKEAIEKAFGVTGVPKGNQTIFEIVGKARLGITPKQQEKK